MNLFEDILLCCVFILFPLIVYLLYLSTNNNIVDVHKRLFFSFSCISSFFLIYKYTNNILLNILVLSSIILISYLKRNYIVANIVVILIIIAYYNHFNYLSFMILPYILLNAISLFKKYKNISDYLYIDIFLLIQYACLLIWIKLFNINIIRGIDTIALFITMILNYIVIHIIYYLYNEGERIINYHMNYKELLQEKQIRLSLFKITHEIKNPIAVIKAYLDMLNVNEKKQVKKYIPIIKGEIDRLLVLLQDFMLVNKNNVEKDIMDINLLLEDVVKSLQPLIDKNKIELITDIIDDEKYIDGDYKRLGQVLINIIKNSIEAMDKDKKIITIKNSIKDNEMNIVIEDNGSGINKKDLEKLKTPFFTTKPKGTGLGVSLSDEIIKAHNGLLIYESNETIGTKVTVKLPLNREEN